MLYTPLLPGAAAGLARALDPGRGGGPHHAGDPRCLAEFATRELRGRGMEIRTGTRLDAVDERSATLSTGEVIPTRTVCWTAGVKPPAVVRELGLPLTDAGRIDVDESLRVKGHANVWAIRGGGARPREVRGPAEPADGAARDPAGPRRRGQPRRHARRRAAAPLPVPHPRRLRGHGPAQSGGDDARAAAPRLCRLV